MRLTQRTALILVLASGVLSAAGLTKYKDWASTPEAYWLSKAERAEWATIDSDSAAETFVTKFRAARGGGFAAAIQSRVAFADKAFSVGKKKGSSTLRGRVLIIFGEPTNVDEAGTAPVGAHEKMDVAGQAAIAADTGGGDRAAGGMSNQYSNAGGPGSDSLRGMKPVDVPKRQSKWTYGAGKVPPALKVPSLTLNFAVDSVKGTDEIASPDAAKLEEQLQAVVEYWAPKTPAAK